LLFLLFPLICGGCVGARSGSEFSQIWILEKSEVDRPYEVIGKVSRAGGVGELTSNAIYHLRNDARKLGGDALIDLVFLPKERTYEAQVIRWVSQ
jgi:hypothetical protein